MTKTKRSPQQALAIDSQTSFLAFDLISGDILIVGVPNEYNAKRDANIVENKLKEVERNTK